MNIDDLRKIIPNIKVVLYKTERRHVPQLPGILEHLAGEERIKFFVIDDETCDKLKNHQVLAVSYYDRDKARKIIVIDLSRVFSGKHVQDKTIVTFFNDWCLWSDYASLVNADPGCVIDAFAQMRGNIFALFLLAFKKVLTDESFFNAFKLCKKTSLFEVCDFFIKRSTDFTRQIFQSLQGSLTQETNLSRENSDSFDELQSHFGHENWQTLLSKGLEWREDMATTAEEECSDEEESQQAVSKDKMPSGKLVPQPKETREKQGRAKKRRVAPSAESAQFDASGDHEMMGAKKAARNKTVIESDSDPSLINQPSSSEKPALDVFAIIRDKVSFQEVRYGSITQVFPDIYECFQHQASDPQKIKFMIIQDSDHRQLPRAGVLVISLYNQKGERKIRVIDLTGNIHRVILTMISTDKESEYQNKIDRKELVFFQDWCVNPVLSQDEYYSVLSQRLFVYLMLGISYLQKKSLTIESLIVSSYSLDGMLGFMVSQLHILSNNKPYTHTIGILQSFEDSLTNGVDLRTQKDHRFFAGLETKLRLQYGSDLRSSPQQAARLSDRGSHGQVITPAATVFPRSVDADDNKSNDGIEPISLASDHQELPQEQIKISMDEYLRRGSQEAASASVARSSSNNSTPKESGPDCSHDFDMSSDSDEDFIEKIKKQGKDQVKSTAAILGQVGEIKESQVFVQQPPKSPTLTREESLPMSDGTPAPASSRVIERTDSFLSTGSFDLPIIPEDVMKFSFNSD